MDSPRELFRTINSFLVANGKIQYKPKEQGIIPLVELDAISKDTITPEWAEDQGFVLTKDNWLTWFFSRMPGDYRLERKWPWDQAMLEDMANACSLFYSQINILVFLVYVCDEYPEIRELVENGSINDVWEKLEGKYLNESETRVCE